MEEVGDELSDTLLINKCFECLRFANDFVFFATNADAAIGRTDVHEYDKRVVLNHISVEAIGCLNDLITYKLFIYDKGVCLNRLLIQFLSYKF